MMTPNKAEIETFITYEVASSWLAGYARHPFLRKLVMEYIISKVTRKYTNYLRLKSAECSTSTSRT